MVMHTSTQSESEQDLFFSITAVPPPRGTVSPPRGQCLCPGGRYVHMAKLAQHCKINGGAATLFLERIGHESNSTLGFPAPLHIGQQPLL